ncbi:hypothetical protein [Muricauda brasiliensis]|uniref:hypothetical protein n=1 Tax=Muricauda brasiliensis TaxID=2162892 RepID=UPI000D3410A1|nr:hypothetical protein [Muricauda brasiliensis]
MKFIYTITLTAFLLIALKGNAQVKIGDNLQLIDASSLLELESSSRVFVLTRVTESQMNAITPLNGALVYNTDAQCIFMYSGDSWRNLCTNNNDINALGNNGLSVVNGNTVQLGGSLIRPTTVQTDAINTLTITGLEENNDLSNATMVLLDDTGALTKTSLDALVQKQESVIAASEGQNQFTTPQTITDTGKIDVYRNGIKISFSAVGPNLIELQSDIICFDNDEIRIVQIQ